MNWGACILSVVDSLEAQGNCSIEVNICQGNKGGHGRSEFIVRLKDAGQHIDFDIMAFAIAHPSMLRRVMFGCMERVAEDGFEQLMGRGYGRPAELALTCWAAICMCLASASVALMNSCFCTALLSSFSPMS